MQYVLCVTWEKKKKVIFIYRRIQLHLLYKDKKTARVTGQSDFHFQVEKNGFDNRIQLLDLMNTNHKGIKKKTAHVTT